MTVLALAPKFIIADTPSNELYGHPQRADFLPFGSLFFSRSAVAFPRTGAWPDSHSRFGFTSRSPASSSTPCSRHIDEAIDAHDLFVSDRTRTLDME
jgi:hypothetical protein